ncbi:ferredoxin [Candidatus Falkowbacteria bacterium]|nr:MAG: ferredoxin [Candidatus Falkowbacteria bacterium]
MAITVDQNTCIGCGACVSLCPNGFKLNDQGKSETINQGDIDCAKNAAESCPVQSIKVD